jgi:integrase
MPKLRDKSTYIRGTLSDEEIDSFINLSCPYSSRFTPVWKQWSMFWTVQAYTGMRPAEVSRLRVTDIDFGLGKINVLETKTGYPREIPISPMIRSSLEKYVKALCHDLLFPTSRDKTVPVSPSAWLENFNIRKRILKLNRPHLSAYSLRHSFASRLISETSIYDVKTLMGHRKISTTEKYLHTNLKRLQKTIDSDPLGERYKSPQDQFHDILKQENVLSEKYFENIHSQVSISEDGSEILIKRKIKHINFP